MIVFLRGQAAAIGEGSVDIDVQGVGYRVWVPLRVSASLAANADLYLYVSQQVREDSNELYGFLTPEERAWFELLLNVSGIGPRSAMQLISASDLRRFMSAVAAEDSAYLVSLPGIGKKTAQRLVVELKDKIDSTWSNVQMEAADTASASLGRDAEKSVQTDVVEALKMLGYPERKALDAASQILKENPLISLEDALRHCLQQLDRSSEKPR